MCKQPINSNYNGICIMVTSPQTPLSQHRRPPKHLVIFLGWHGGQWWAPGSQVAGQQDIPRFPNVEGSSGRRGRCDRPCSRSTWVTSRDLTGDFNARRLDVWFCPMDELVTVSSKKWWYLLTKLIAIGGHRFWVVHPFMDNPIHLCRVKGAGHRKYIYTVHQVNCGKCRN